MPDFSKDIRYEYMYNIKLFQIANYQLRHQATHSVGYQPRDFRQPPLFPSDDCVGYVQVYILTFSCPQRVTKKNKII